MGTVDILVFLSLWMVERSVSSTVPCFYLSHWVLGNWRPFSSCAGDGSWTCELILALWFMALLSLFWASVWCAPDLSSFYMFIIWPSMGAKSLCWAHLALQSWLSKFPPPPKTSQMVLPLVANSLVGLAIEKGCPLNALQVWSAQRIGLHTFKIFWVVIPLVGGFCCCVKPLQLQRLSVLQQTRQSAPEVDSGWGRASSWVILGWWDLFPVIEDRTVIPYTLYCLGWASCCLHILVFKSWSQPDL